MPRIGLQVEDWKRKFEKSLLIKVTPHAGLSEFWLIVELWFHKNDYFRLIFSAANFIRQELHNINDGHVIR